MIKAQQYNIYKGKGGKFGAVQFNFQPPHYYCSNTKCRTKNFTGDTQLCDCRDVKMVAREGAIFLEITSAKAADVYDWENKIIMALSVNDMGKILVGLRTGTDVNLLHDPNAAREGAGKVKKKLSFSSPQGIEKGCIVNASEYNETNADAPKKHTVPMTLDEVTVLATLLQAGITRSLAW